jgi:hypothetical protein
MPFSRRPGFAYQFGGGRREGCLGGRRVNNGRKTGRKRVMGRANNRAFALLGEPRTDVVELEMELERLSVGGR